MLVETISHLSCSAVSQRQQASPSYDIEQDIEQIARTLLKRSALDVNPKSKHGFTPLSLAARQGHEAFVRLLLNTPGVDFNVTDQVHNNPGNPLLLAAQFDRQAIVRLLLDVPGVDVSPLGYLGNTPLSEAAQFGHEGVVKQLIGVPGIDVNVKNENGDTHSQ